MPTHRPTLTRGRAIAVLAHALVVALGCTGLVLAAALVPAPHAVLPFIVVVGVATPMTVTQDLPRAITALRHHRAVSALRRGLAELPETAHPLDA
jgi:hypothetical protein